MNTSPDDRERPGPRDMDAEFARMLEQEGLELGPAPPREPPAGDHPRGPLTDPPALTTSCGASAPIRLPTRPEPSPAPLPGRPSWRRPGTGPARRARRGRFLSDDGSSTGFRPPDPIARALRGALWSWTALIGGFC